MLMQRPDGATNQDHLKSLARQAAELGLKFKAIQTLRTPPFPAQISHLWRWFDDIRFGTVGSLTWNDLAAWKHLSGEDPQPWEIETLWLLEIEYRKARSQSRKDGMTERG